MSRRFRTGVITDIIYSMVITCLVEVFLATNLSMPRNCVLKAGRDISFLVMFVGAGPLMTVVYVLIGIVMLAITLFLMQEKSIRYIDRISAATQNISEGDLNTMAEVIGDDEFSGMATDLNEMVENIRELMDKRRESEWTKDELTTNVAHNLWTPLTSIIDCLGLLLGPAQMSPEMRKKYIDITHTKTKRLEKLIEGLLGLTELNYGKIFMEISKVDIIKLLSQLLEEFYSSFEEKDLSYEFQSNAPAKVISADGNLPVRSFEDLVRSAIKYGADGERILVRVRTTEQIVTVSVTNHDYAILKDGPPITFDKSYRVEQFHSTNTGGTGLGLAIAKNVVDVHGGTIGVTSDLSDTVFTVRPQVNFDINKENFGKLG